MDSISFKAFYIPREDYWKSMPGDAHPKSLSVYEDKVYVSAATSGAAIFEMTDSGLKYIGLKEISSDWDQIYPIAVTGSGRIVSGDWNWNTIHVNNE